MSISDGSDPFFSRRKMGKTRSVNEEMDEKVFIARKSWHFSIYRQYNSSTFPYLSLIWRANNYVSRQGKAYIRETTVLFLLYKLKTSGIVPFKTFTVCVY